MNAYPPDDGDHGTAPELARELIERSERDQAARLSLPHSHTYEQWQRLVAPIDDENAPRMAQIITEHGWPGYALVGRRGAGAAWILVQHAPIGLQDRALPLLRAACAADDAHPVHLAYLEDRVNVKHDRPQRYGTQFLEADGAITPYPLADPERVDELRDSVGLEPLTDYLGARE